MEAIQKLRHSRVMRLGLHVFFTACLLVSSRELILNAWIANENTIFVSQILDGVTSVTGPSEAILILLGVWGGLTLVWLFDTYKRRLAFVPLSVGAIGLYFVVTEGLFANLSAMGVVLFLSFFALAAEVGGLPLVRYLLGRRVRITGNPPVELRDGPRAMFWLLCVLVIGSLLVIFSGGGSTSTGIVEWQQTPLDSILAGIVLIGLFKNYTGYDNKTRVIQLGPARSGKTTMIGGLYSDAPGSNSKSPRLDEVEYQLTNGGKIPDDRTSSPEIIEFSYISDASLTKSKTSIHSVDHKGELLTTGGRLMSDLVQSIDVKPDGDSPAESSSLFEKARFKLSNYLSDSWTIWQSGISDINSLYDVSMEPREDSIYDTSDLGSDELLKKQREALAKLVEGADLVILTVPLDDFLGPVIDRGNEPSYTGAIVIERTDIGEDERYEITLPDPVDESQYNKEDVAPGNSYQISRNETGRLVYDECGEEFIRASFESFEALPRIDDDRRYIIPGKGVRVNPSEYKREYRELVDYYSDDHTKSFAWVTTMSDLVFEDFKSVYEGVQDSERDSDDVKRAKDIEGAFEADMPAVLERSVDEEQGFVYRLFSKWIQYEVLQPQWPGVVRNGDSADIGLLEESHEKTIYPVWFAVDDESSSTSEELVLKDNSANHVLQGSKYLRTRIEGLPVNHQNPFDERDVENAYRGLYQFNQEHSEEQE